HGVALVLANPFLKAHSMSWREFLGLNHPRLKRAIAVALIAGILLVPSALLLKALLAEAISALQMEPVEQVAIKVVQTNEAWWQRLIFGVTSVMVAPLAEEMVFRGIFYPFIKQLGYPRMAFFVSSLVFAFVHFNLLTFLPLAYVGIALVLVYERTDNLLAPVLTHAFFNAVNFSMLVFHDELSRLFQLLRERI